MRLARVVLNRRIGIDARSRSCILKPSVSAVDRIGDALRTAKRVVFKGLHRPGDIARGVRLWCLFASHGPKIKVVLRSCRVAVRVSYGRGVSKSIAIGTVGKCVGVTNE